MDREYDLFVAVHRIPDPVHHFFIAFVDQRTPVFDADKARQWGDSVNHFYRKMDHALGEALERLRPDDTIFVISDHGGNITPPHTVNLNVWLAQQGLLWPAPQSRTLKQQIYALNRRLLPGRLRAAMRRRAPPGVRGGVKDLWKGLQAIDYSRTRAYHFPIKNPPLDAIVINLRGRQPQGTVEPAEYEALRERIMQDLTDIRDPRSGEPVVAAVYSRDDLYHGPFAERAPDIVVCYREMYKEGPLARGEVIGETPFDELQAVPGAHDEKGIFLAMGPGIAPARLIEGARLIDVPATILDAMDLPVPAEMDGRVLTEIYASEKREVRSVEMAMARKSEDTYLTDEEEQQIKEKLKGWGYL
jgi:predicted AlkP superfamily phosphohydrolase/phosphomutase